MSQYPQDEFDVAGRDRGPEGVHRRPRSLLRALAPFIAVIVLVPLLAWGAVGLLSGGGDEEAEPEPAPPAATTEGETEEEPPDPTTSAPPEEETATPEDEGPGEDVVLTTSISVLNGAEISGIAGDAAAQLEGAGFTSVGAADYGAASPEDTTLYYRNAELLPTAEAVGEIIGIDNLVELASATQNVEIAIVLRPDYTDG